MKQEFWTLRKVVLCGMFGVLTWVIQIAISIPLVSVLGPGMGAPIMLFLGMLLFVLFRRIVAAKGAMFLIGAIVAVLFLPIPALGPAGFLPKVVILFAGAIMVEVILLLTLPRWPKIGAAVSGAAGDVVMIILMIWLFSLFGLPGAKKFLDLALIFIILGIVEGSLGGLTGELIYEKIQKRPIIQRLQRK